MRNYTKDKSRFIRPKELCKMLGISIPTLYRWDKKGILPPKREIGPNTVGYRSDEIQEFIENRPEVKKEVLT